MLRRTSYDSPSCHIGHDWHGPIRRLRAVAGPGRRPSEYRRRRRSRPHRRRPSSAAAGGRRGVEVLTRGPVHEAFAQPVILDEGAGFIDHPPAAGAARGDRSGPEARGQPHPLDPGILELGHRSQRLHLGLRLLARGAAQHQLGSRLLGRRSAEATNGSRGSGPPPTPRRSSTSRRRRPPWKKARRARGSPDNIWIPGCWVRHEGRYAWRPGFWEAGAPRLGLGAGALRLHAARMGLRGRLLGLSARSSRRGVPAGLLSPPACMAGRASSTLPILSSTWTA